jgi:hypothetical protein
MQKARLQIIGLKGEIRGWGRGAESRKTVGRGAEEKP